MVTGPEAGQVARQVVGRAVAAAPVAGVVVGAPVAMPPLDAWMHRHESSGAMCMTIEALAWFDGPPPDLAALRCRVAERWRVHDRLRLVPVVAGGRRAWPGWAMDREFDAVAHVVAAEPGAPLVPTQALAARLLAQPLPAGRPPWQLHLLPAGEGFALLLRAHHGLLDGMSLLALLRTLLDRPAALPPPRRGPAGDGRAARGGAGALRALADLVPRGRVLPFHGPVDGRRAVSWLRLPPAELAAARAALPSGRASANAVFLATAGGALRSAGLTGRLALPGVCAMVPVDVRPEGEADLLGNHYATVRVPLPLGGDPLRRLREVDEFTRRAGLRPRAVAQARLVASRPRRYGAVAALLGRYADSPLYASVLCSSMATHCGALWLGGARCTDMAVMPPLSPGHPLALTMVLHDGGAVLAVTADHAHRDLAPRLCALARQEVAALRAGPGPAPQ
ncbi:hypothetical protein GCM10010218_09940 [Streptomyces mashuensis]|uniref:diacylglycerol O-acyltransferase n=1 Tax=Streptomyces mashuensis TaxID=33904 RepID=A0A919EAN7_9ACTN|nr:wax ester/triacylglycerol synthase domain-containing protein [Streptomyces mashuensis]GHF30655.1 hypothetical protein GCM10010218_09940 [Streptomyces mashuensis]